MTHSHRETPTSTRRQLFPAVLGLGLMLACQLPLHAASAPAEASAGVKGALEMGVQAAVAQLGKPDGFLADPKLRIPLPSALDKAAKLMKATGQGAKVQELETAMNRAAEAAVPLGKEVLMSAVKNMTVTDAVQLLQGGDNAVTQFFVGKTRPQLTQNFLPLVQKVTSEVGLAERYNQVAGKAAGMGLLKENESNVERYVTDKTLDALYTVIAQQEKALRDNPAQAGSALLKKVFGGLK